MTDNETKTPTPTRGVPVDLGDGVPRRLRYSLRTMREVRQAFGDIEQFDAHDENLGKLLWFGLRHEDDTLSVPQVEELVDLEHLTTIMEAVTEALGGKALAVALTTPTGATTTPPENQSPREKKS